MSEAMTFSDLHVHYGTGRSVTLSGTGKDRVTAYRAGVKCDLGDLEEADWKQRVRDLIRSSGEEDLFGNLLSYVKEFCPWCRTKADQEREALDLHASRIFDDALWVGYIPFNQAYRPEVLKSADLVCVKTVCCKKQGLVTRARLERGYRSSRTVCCPICGKWSEFEEIRPEG